MSFFIHNQIETWYELRGHEGMVVTCINGHTRPASDFDIISAGLLERGYRVLVFDNRGSGKTKSGLEFSCHDLVDDLFQLWNHLGIKISHLLGFSMGGYLAQAVAISHPDKVDRLILISTSSGNHHVNHDADSWISDAETNLEDKLAGFFSPNFVKNNPLYMQKMLELTRKAITEGRFNNRSEAQKEALLKFPVKARLNEITCPTLLIHGRCDQSVYPAAALELHAGIKNSRLRWLDDTAHFSMIEKPREILHFILDFI